MKLSNIEVKGKKNKRRLNIQKVFNLASILFALTCCVFYGGRFLKFYLEHNKSEEAKLLADSIKENNIENNNLKNINGDIYFQGTDINNYIKYSNLIWRIIRINSNNSITVVLDNPITALAAGEEKNFKNSYINEWLNHQDKEYTGILQNNLNNHKNYLTYTNTCNDQINDTKNITCKNRIENTYITVPSLNDYVNTGGQKGFMNNNEFYYLINNNKEKKIWYIDDDGKVGTSDGTDIIGVKPVITLKSNLSLINGDGSKENPYIIENTSGLFGSYVKLGNDLWRIYSVEGETLKLSLNSHLTLNGNEVKYKYSSNGYQHNDTKQGSLAYYLKNTYLPTLSYNNIINETKYSNGTYNTTTNFDYKETLKEKVDTKVTTLSIGDIILNNLNTNYFTTTGVSKDTNYMYVIRSNFEIYTKNSSSNLNIVPVISINKNLLTQGEGTLNNPLEVNNEE